VILREKRNIVYKNENLFGLYYKLVYICKEVYGVCAALGASTNIISISYLLIMETKNKMTAEQSLKLINETIENNRRVITKKNGSYYILWGILLSVISLVIFFLWDKTGSAAWNLLWFSMPIIGHPLALLLDRGEEKVPGSFLSRLTAWIWGIFGVFSLSLALIAFFWVPMNLSLVIILLFGFAECISGITLKSWPVIVSGLIIGLGGAVLAAGVLATSASQILLFTLAGVVLILTGVLIKIQK
jgi:hypothetical protein